MNQRNELKERRYEEKVRNVCETLGDAIDRDVIDKTLEICEKALKKGMAKGRSIDGIIAASLYDACRISNTPITLGEISNILKMRRLSLASYYRSLVLELDLAIPSPDPLSYVGHIAKKLALSMKSEEKALEMLKTKNGGFDGKNPTALAV